MLNIRIKMTSFQRQSLDVVLAYNAAIQQDLTLAQTVGAIGKIFEQLVGFVYLLSRIGLVQLLTQRL